MKVETKTLKESLELLTSIIHLDNLKPITSFLQVCARDNKLYMGMSNNITKVAYSIDCTEDLPTIVLDAQQLLKLTKLTTKKDITITYNGGIVEIKGNGKYKQAVQVDESGEALKLDIKFPTDSENAKEFNLADLSKALRRNRLSLVSGDDYPSLYRYYCKDGLIITSDSQSIALTKGELFDLELHPAIVSQLAGLNEKVTISEYKGLYYVTNGVFHYLTPKLKDNLFPIEQVEPYINIDEELECVGSYDKKVFISAIKRLDLFKDTLFDIPSIVLVCEHGDVKIKDTKGRAEETVGSCAESLELSVKLAIDSVLKVLNAMETEVELFASEDVAVFMDEQGKYILSCVEEE